jgi:hypothetical protein
LQIKRHGKIFERTRFDANEFVIYDDYAEIILYTKYGVEKGRTKIDLEDVDKCKEYKWHIHYSQSKEYIFSHEKENSRKNLRLHRFVLDFYDISLDIDHKNGDSFDNRKENLNICTRQENMMNQRKLPSNNTTGYIGVWFNKKTNKFAAQIKLNRKPIHLGEYKDINDAIAARKEAELKYFGKNKLANFEEKEPEYVTNKN